MEKKSLTGLLDQEFNGIMDKHPEFLQKLIGFTNLTEETAKEKTKKWFYTPNSELDHKKPIEVYRKEGPDSLYHFFEKPNWASST
ncbi:hypothetical protein GOV03_03850 [Candidatus Woesearchaeota archaeon]|nr:hypothetical protein [Candidatus Woesearchaeota archaeon]